jgi:hypothetical protein
MTRFHRDLISHARDAGVRDARVVVGGKHGRLVGTYTGTPICMIVATSPSDTNTGRAARHFLGRMLRRMSR